MALLTIAGLTLREASRRKLLIALGLITLIVIPLIAWGFSWIPSIPCHGGDCGPGNHRSIEAVLLILVAYMFGSVIGVAAPFLAAPAIASDIESHLLLGILPRPIRRSEVVIGKWLGLATLVTAFTVLAAGLQFFGVWVAVGYVPPHPVLTILFIVGEGIALLTLALLGSTRLAPITCGIIAVTLFFITWFVGVVGQIGAAVGLPVLRDIGTASSLVLPTDGLWRGAIFNLEPVSMIALTNSSRAASANPFAVASAPTAAYVIWAVLWIAAVLALAVKSFSTREV
jgi:ABC-type transport system involved in multi-copper enzyme maturation permease subunit